MTLPAPRKLVVTGASSGIGRSIALLSAAAGWDVLATVRSDDQRTALEQAGCHTAILELRESESIETFARLAATWCEGRLDALVNNAGVAFAGPVEDLRMTDVREQFEVNVFGHIHVTQLLLPALREARGRIVFVSSDRAQFSIPIYGAYVASKRALNAFAEVLAVEMQPFSVAVAILELGSFESNIRMAVRSRLESAERSGSIYGNLVREAKANLGKPPLGLPDEAAGAVLKLLQGDAPPLFNTFPATSLLKVIRSQLSNLERQLAQLLNGIEQASPDSRGSSEAP